MLAAPENPKSIGPGYSMHFDTLYYRHGRGWTVEVAVMHDGKASITHTDGFKEYQEQEEYKVMQAVVAFIRAMNMKMQDNQWTPEQTWEHYFGKPHEYSEADRD